MDRFSGLPEDVIRHILSFLPTKSFVRTSLLAKRWRFLWADVPVLGFTCNGHVGECSGTGREITTLDDSNITNTFHVCNSAGTSTDYDFASWIATLSARNVRNLVIGLHSSLRLPRCLFVCKTLVDLFIFDCVGIPADCAVYFPALRKLELADIGFDSEKSLSHLISGCPVLDELIIHRMLLVTCNVSSPTLTRLDIDINMVVFIKMDCPALRYLSLCVHQTMAHPSVVDISASALDSVVNATLDLNRGKVSYSSHAIEFAGKLCNVRSLSLWTSRMEIPDSAFSALTTEFRNLSEFTMAADWRFITKFFENAKNLQVLSIWRMDYHNTQHWIEPKQVSGGLLSQLVAVHLFDFEWSTKNEFDMVKFILKNAKALKIIEIVYTPRCEFDRNEKVEVLNKLASFDTRSTCLRLRLFNVTP